MATFVSHACHSLSSALFVMVSRRMPQKATSGKLLEKILSDQFFVGRYVQGWLKEDQLDDQQVD